MKKTICLLLSFLFLFTLIVPAYASNERNTSSDYVVYYEDGSYITVHSPIIAISPSRATLQTVTASRPITYTDSSGEIGWEYSLVATFSYIYGSVVVCTDSSYTYAIYKNSWSFSDGSTSRSGGTAYGYGTFKNKFLLITTKTVNIDTYLTCDIYGNLS